MAPPLLSWTKLRLIDGDRYASANATPIDSEQEKLLITLIRDQIRLWLAINAHKAARFVKEHYSALKLYSTEVMATVVISDNGREEEFRFMLPINAEMCPFVGHAFKN
jgi:hypothetical protein